MASAYTPDGQLIEDEDNRRRMRAGELYYANTPQLAADRQRCALACKRYNAADELTRRQRIELWKEYVIFPPLPMSHQCICIRSVLSDKQS